MNYTETVRLFVVDNFLFGEGDSLAKNTSFMEEGIVDSMGILEIVSFIEETYSITIKDNELVPENLDSLKNIATFLEAKLPS